MESNSAEDHFSWTETTSQRLKNTLKWPIMTDKDSKKLAEKQQHFLSTVFRKVSKVRVMAGRLLHVGFEMLHRNITNQPSGWCL